MPTIMDLPQELLELVFEHLIAPYLGPLHEQGYRPNSVALTVSRMRLVCRAWAAWLFEHHLYQTLWFQSSTTLLAFLDHLQSRRSPMLPRPKCRYLMVFSLWTHDQRNLVEPPRSDLITPEILESLILLFSDSIITLHLGFVDFFGLPSQTIKAMGQIKNLCTLRLDPDSDNLDKDNTYWWDDDDEEWDVSMEANATCLNSLLTQAQALKLLEVGLPVRFPSMPAADLQNKVVARYPAITYLKVDTMSLSPDALLNLSRVLKPTLKLLSIRDFSADRHADLFVPVYETLKDTLEGLSVICTESAQQIRHLSFPKLRVLAIHWLSDFSLLSKPIFSQSPIETVAINSSYMLLDGVTRGAFSPLAHLKQFVIMDAPPDYTPSQMWLDACEARHVKCINIYQSDLSLLMRL